MPESSLPTHSTTDRVKQFIAGGIAGASAKTVIAPLDRVKVIFQTSHAVFSLRKVGHELHRIATKEGWSKLWRGHTATLARVYPYAAIQFTTYGVARDTLLNAPGRTKPTLSPVEKFVCGSLAGGLSVALTFPLDLLRVQLALRTEQQAGQHAGILHTAKQIIAARGVSGLYRGLLPTILGILPYSGVSFMTYHTFQQHVHAKHEEGTWLQLHPVAAKLCGGALAGLLGQSVTYPLDIVRRRMQSHGTAHPHGQHALPSTAGHGPPPSMRAVLSHAAGQGIQHGLFKGLTMNWIKGPISVGVSFTVFDLLRQAIGLPSDSHARKS